MMFNSQKFPTLRSLSYWKTNLKTEACFISGHPAEGVPWITEIGLARFQEQDLLGRAEAQNEGLFLRGRQIAYMIGEYFLVTGTHESIFDFTDLMSVSVRGDDVQGFGTRWDEVLLSIKETPQDHILESMYKMRIRDSEQLKTVLALYDQDIEQKDVPPNFMRLKNMVNK